MLYIYHNYTFEFLLIRSLIHLHFCLHTNSYFQPSICSYSGNSNIPSQTASVGSSGKAKDCVDVGLYVNGRDGTCHSIMGECRHTGSRCLGKSPSSCYYGDGRISAPARSRGIPSRIARV